jgi:putative hydrolase of the HAD superfamily
MNYKNIIFDLGQVVLNIDFDATPEAFRKFGFNDFTDLYSRARQVSLFDNLETGRITPDEFRTNLLNLINLHLSFHDIENAWNAMILDFPPNRIKFLEDLRNKYRIFLLSNTNKIHFDFFSRNFKQTYKYDFSRLFEKMYLSFQLGLRKPDKRIFEFVLNDSNLLPGETLFIDDTLEHINSAVSCGINVIHLKPGEEINDIL